MSIKFRIHLIALLLGLLLFGLMNSTSFASGETRGIVHIAGDLYRFQENAHFSVFLVTPEGVISTDPLNAATARWLKAELKRRFDKTVKYLIYSHHHADHASGGEVFSDTATFIAHENAVQGFIDDQVPTALPDVTFSDEMTITLGGKVVELTYAGLSHSDNSVIMHFPEERAVYAVDFVLAKALPYQDLPTYAYFYPEWLASLHKLEEMDFDILLPGHDQVGTHKDVRGFRHYLEDMESAVLDGIEAGLSVDEMQKTILLEDYQAWDMYDEWRALNVKGMYGQLTRDDP
jgi:glyoxylase-like metal-dependent hydrolase (beta-lactamase superfamily II)